MGGSLVHAVRAWADGAGALGVLVLTVLDSSVLALPNAVDALVMYLSIQRPATFWIHPIAAAVGTVIGSVPLYVLARRGGEAFLQRRLAGGRSARAVRWYRRSAFLAIAVPALMPPPFPLKVFVLLAGVTSLPFWKVAAALSLGRGGRHLIEAWLARTYREQAIVAFDRYGAGGAIAVSVVVTLVVAALVFWPTREREPEAAPPSLG